MDSTKYRLGDLIRGWRDRAGYSQKYLASLIGVRRYQTVSDWERSEQFPKRNNLLDIAVALELSESEKEELFKAAATADLSRVDADLENISQAYKSHIETLSRQVRSATGVHKIDQGYIHSGLQEIASKGERITIEQDIGQQQISRNSEPDISADSLLLMEEVRAMIIAPAGSGKTFLQKHLSLLLARDFAGDVLPVPIDWPFECCDIERQELLVGVLSGSDLPGETLSRLSKYLDQRLCNGTAVALIDNWTENSSSVKILDACLIRWKRVIVFSRYAPSSDSPLLQMYELTCLGLDEMRRLVRDWPLITTRTLDTETAIAHIHNQSRDLFSAPLFLDLYCAWWAEHSTAPTAWELLEWAADRTSQGETGPGSLNVRFRSALELLAWDGYARTLSGAPFRSEFDAAYVEKLWREHWGDESPGLFKIAFERGLVRKVAVQDVLAFPHPMLQASFAAHYWLRMPGWLDYVKQVASCPPWADVIVFAVVKLEKQGHLVDLERLLENLLSPDAGDVFEINWLLAGRCVAALSERTRELLEDHGIGAQIRQKLMEWVVNPPSQALLYAVHGLLTGIHTRCLVNDLSKFAVIGNGNEDNKAPLILGLMCADDAVDVLCQIAQDDRLSSITRSAAVKGLGWSHSEKAVKTIASFLGGEMAEQAIEALADNNSVSAATVLLDNRYAETGSEYDGEIGDAITRLSSPKILDVLESDLLRGEDVDTNVLRAVANVGGEEAIRILRRHLYNSKTEVFKQTVELLSAMNTPLACNELICLAEDKDQPGIRRMQALQALPTENGLWPPKRLIRLLFEVCRGDTYVGGLVGRYRDEWSVQPGLVAVLSQTKDISIIRILEDSLIHAEGRARRLLSEIVANLKRSDALPILMQLVSDPDYYVRESALLGLAYLRTPGIFEQVSGELKKAIEDGRELHYLLHTLAEVGDQQAIPLLEEVLCNRYPNYEFAIPTLGAIGGKDASRILTAYANDSAAKHDFVISRVLAPALVSCGTAETTHALVDLIEDYDAPRLASEAVSGLQDVTNPDALDALIAALTHTNYIVRHRAVIALGKIQSPRAVPALLQLGKAPFDFTWMPAVEALRAGFDETHPDASMALHALMDAIEHEHEFVRRLAWIGLSGLSPQFIQDDLLHSMQEVIDQEQNRLVLTYAIDALGKVGGKRVVSYLQTLLQRFDDQQTLQSVILALNDIGDASSVSATVQALFEHFSPCSDSQYSIWLSLARKEFFGELFKHRSEIAPVFYFMCAKFKFRIMPDNRIYLPDGRLVPCEEAAKWL